MLNTAANRAPATVAERVAAAIDWIHIRLDAPARDCVTRPVWEFEALADYRMMSCAACGEVVDPMWRLCQHCGSNTR